LDRITRLDEIVARYNLNEHPFYQDWAAGTLPTEKLQAYAADFGHFLKFIAKGWERIGHGNIAAEERYHETLWQDFQSSIESGSELRNQETSDLVAESEKYLADPATALGALYAYEVQQPKTAASKLLGLDRHYNVSPDGKRYFVVHADDVEEINILRTDIDNLSEEEFSQAEASCRVICEKLWKALDGAYGQRALAVGV
jgi:pyrroloquinoline-quinone synthase